MSNYKRDSLKICNIGQSAAKFLGDKKKVQRLEKVILGKVIPFHMNNYVMEKNYMQEEISSSAEHKVICRVCNKSFISITNTHLKRHSMTIDDYRKEFPNEALGDFSRFDKWRNSEENRNHLIKNNKMVYENAELLEKKRRNRNLACDNIEYRHKLSEANKKASKTEKMQKYYSTVKDRTSPWMKMSNYDRWKIRFGIEEANKRQNDWLIKNKLPNTSKNTLPERNFKKFLDDQGIKYEQQYKIAGVICDFFLSDYNVVVEIDGDFWHANPKIYSAEDIICKKNLCAKEIWRLDEIKNRKIVGSNLSLIRYWASDLKNKTYNEIYEDIVHSSKKLEDAS